MTKLSKHFITDNKIIKSKTQQSLGEINNKKEALLELVFSKELTNRSTQALSREELIALILRGGYPSIQSFTSRRDADDWYSSQLSTILQRDVQDLAHVEGLTVLPNLLQLLATRTSGQLNSAELSRASGLPVSTLNRYLVLLEALFLIHRQPSWSGNLSKRLVKAPRLYCIDTGIASYLLNIGIERLMQEPKMVGMLLENFVVSELHKQITWHHERITAYHFRTQSGAEVDIVLENSRGHVVGIEVKASQTVIADDFKGLKELAQAAEKSFYRGILLYSGDKMLPFGQNLWAVPISLL